MALAATFAPVVSNAPSRVLRRRFVSLEIAYVVGWLVGYCNMEDVSEQPKPLSPTRKADILFDFIGRESDGRIGEPVPLSMNQAGDFGIESGRELGLIIEYLVGQGLIQDRPTMGMFRPTLTFEGWVEYETRRAALKRGTTCFVAMSFNPALDSIFHEAIRPAVRECGYDDHRVDQTEHNKRITDEIIAGIRGAKFMIADVTEQRPGVYYEAGFAAGLDRDVIFSCRKDDLPNCHFDTRDFNHIVWTDTEDLRRRLLNRIIRTVGKAVRD